MENDFFEEFEYLLPYTDKEQELMSEGTLKIYHLNVSEIIERFGNLLTEEQLKQIENYDKSK